MKLDWKIITLAFLMVFLMAYALGVAVSGIVDNRMRTSLMNMPRPVIKIVAGDTVASQSSVHGLTADSDYELEHFEDSPNTRMYKGTGTVTDTYKGTGTVTDTYKGTGTVTDTYKGTDTNKGTGTVTDTYKGTDIGLQKPRELEIQVDKQTIEKPYDFKNYPATYWSNDTYRIPNKVVAETRKQYGRRENDPTVSSWGSEYAKQAKIWEFQLSQPPYLPSNAYDMDDFAKIEDGVYKDNSGITDIQPSGKLDTDTRVVLSARDSPLVARNQRRADFKCQRLTDNCTMNHHPKIYWQDKGGKKSYDVRVYEKELEESKARTATEEMMRLRKEQAVLKRMYEAEQTPVDEEAEEEYDETAEATEEDDEIDREGV